MEILSESEFQRTIGKISTNPDYDRFITTIEVLMEMLDEGDMDDFYGSEGWRHRLGWDQ